jgi:hypothetical protein
MIDSKRLTLWERNMISIRYEIRLVQEHPGFGADCEECAEHAFYDVLLEQLERRLDS